jgi:hypothetical protein
MINACHHDQLEVVYNFVNNAKKRKSPNKSIANRNKRERKRQREADYQGAAYEDIAPGVGDESSLNKTPSAEDGKAKQTSAVAAQMLAEPPQQKSKTLGWWESFDASEILSFDTEMVTLLEKDEFGKHKQQAATVAIVVYDGNSIYEVHCNI